MESYNDRTFATEDIASLKLEDTGGCCLVLIGQLRDGTFFDMGTTDKDVYFYDADSSIYLDPDYDGPDFDYDTFDAYDWCEEHTIGILDDEGKCKEFAQILRPLLAKVCGGYLPAVLESLYGEK